MASVYEPFRLAPQYDYRTPAQQHADQLNQLDADRDRLAEALSKALDGDVDLHRFTSDHAETQGVSLSVAIDFELEPGDTVEGELVWFLECLAGALGRKVVAK